MELKPINLQKKLAKFSDHWSPKIIAQMNDYRFKLVKFQGDFIWHNHDDTDEVFIVLDGEMSIEFRDGKVDRLSWRVEDILRHLTGGAVHPWLCV